MNNSKSFFYARVSSISQSVNRQIDCIKLYNLEIDERDIFIDSKSGKDFSRENYLLLKQICRPSDVIYVKSLDRFGRNYKEIVEEWRDQNPNGSKRQCKDETGLTYPTIRKWWNEV